MIRQFCALLIACALASCGSAEGERSLAVSIIGPKAKLTDPNGGAANPPSLALSGAISQGLVRYNPAGEVVPALAESWMVTDDGLSYIFRVGRLHWADDRRVSAQDVAASLRASLSGGSRNPLRSDFSNVAEIVAMTDRVIEVRLKAPMPHLLQLLARPEMAILSKGRGTGPMQVMDGRPGALVLRPLVHKDQAKDVTEVDLKRREIKVFGERPAEAITRFSSGTTTLVLGGGYLDLPYLFSAKLPRDVVRRDAVAGLFGLVASANSSALSTANARRALSMAIDRKALMARFGLANWAGVDVANFGVAEVLIKEENRPDWPGLSMEERRARARELIGSKVVIRLAVPKSPGGNILFAQLKADFASIGVTLLRAIDERVGDLRVIDDVAPYQNPYWYLNRLSCNRGFYCSEKADEAVSRAQAATTSQARDAVQVEAANALNQESIFMPLAAPLRWSLARPETPGFRENVNAAHPIIWLRPAN